MVESHGMMRSTEIFHFLVDGISRFASGKVTATLVVCGPGVNTKPSDGSATLSAFGSTLVRVRSSALGGLNRTLAPDCEKTDWKMRPS